MIKEYQINLNNLKIGNHEFTYHLDDAFFAAKKNDMLEGGNCDVRLAIDKSETVAKASFEISGSIKLVCDRSLEVFDHALEVDEKIFFKFGEAYKELSEDVIVLPETNLMIDVSDFLNEFVTLAIPSRKIHPDFEDEPNSDYGNIYFSTMSDEEKSEGEEEQGRPIDPRWNKLKKLKF